MYVQYPYTLTKEQNGSTFIQFVDFPSGVAEASPEEDAHKIAQDMIEGMVEVYKEEGLPFPKASPVLDMDSIVVSL